jgi:hypothetical protein
MKMFARVCGSLCTPRRRRRRDVRAASSAAPSGLWRSLSVATQPLAATAPAMYAPSMLWNMPCSEGVARLPSCTTSVQLAALPAPFAVPLYTHALPLPAAVDATREVLQCMNRNARAPKKVRSLGLQSCCGGGVSVCLACVCRCLVSCVLCLVSVLSVSVSMWRGVVCYWCVIAWMPCVCWCRAG